MFIYNIFIDILESCLVKKRAKMGCAKPTNIYLLDFLKYINKHILTRFSKYALQDILDYRKPF